MYIILTPNELVVVLHATEVCLGQTISDEEIWEGKLTNLLIKEDFDVLAGVCIYYNYLLFCH